MKIDLADGQTLIIDTDPPQTYKDVLTIKYEVEDSLRYLSFCPELVIWFILKQ